MKHIREEFNSIILRNTQKEDLDFVITCEQETENAQYVGQWTKEQHRNALLREDILHLIVEEKETNKATGYIILAGLTSSNKSIEFMRIALYEKGKGFGRESLNGVKKIVFEQLNAHRLWLDVRYQNRRAQHLYKSAGFIQEGVLRECILSNGGYESLIIMSLLKHEYTSDLTL